MAFKLQDILPVGMLLVVTAIALSIGADVIDDVQADQTADSYAYNISDYGLQAQDELGSWMDTLALVVVAAIIIGTLITSFAMGR